MTGLRSPAEVESLIARMDVVVTTRLHGLVLALKNGVPAIAVDTVAGGAKVTRQAEALGWSHVYPAEGLEPETLAAALDELAGDEGRAAAHAAASGPARASRTSAAAYSLLVSRPVRRRQRVGRGRASGGRSSVVDAE